MVSVTKGFLNLTHRQTETVLKQSQQLSDTLGAILLPPGMNHSTIVLAPQFVSSSEES